MNAPLTHPVWCDPRLCTVVGKSGEHRSEPVNASAGNATDGTPLVAARLWLEAVPEDAQGETAAAGTFILVDLEQSGERGLFLFGAGQAKLLSALLRRLSELAKAGAR